jgi:deoxyribodipyrimidine photo-lyase
MTAFRRLGWNFALQHAAELARGIGKPLLVVEILKVDYPFASERLHGFMLDGISERNGALQESPVFHYPFVERNPGEADGLIKALAKGAACVVSDDFPAFFLPKWVSGEAEAAGIRFDLVDSNGLIPLRAPEKVFSAAYHFRRYIQKSLMDHLPESPEADPLQTPIPPFEPDVLEDVWERWPPADGDRLRVGVEALRDLPLDSAVGLAPTTGTSEAALRTLRSFLNEGLGRYAEDRNHPDAGATSGLSPFLHFGTLSSHQVFSEVSGWEGWTPLRLSEETRGAREGWWGMGSGAEAFLDQFITWRELGFNMCAYREDYARYRSLPEWARNTLELHQGDPRAHLYEYEDFRTARTHDPLWNAAQRQLVEEGTIHNYLRMLWGKKILEWTASPVDALEIMLDLNDRFALDGRDPNSYSGIFWCLGRYDRGWPERPVYGKVRSMSSDRTRKKVRLEEYLLRYGPEVSGSGPAPDQETGA